MDFPHIDEAKRVARLQPPQGKVRMVLDTDTFNEIDDQFALVYSLLSPERLKVEAIYAAPFYNQRSMAPEEGMEKSYEEILRLLQLLSVPTEEFAFRGSEGFLSLSSTPFRSSAALDLIERAMKSPDDDPLYVVAIGAPTNVASAILIEPAIIERICVVWLAGNSPQWPHNHEFNMSQDPAASRVIVDSGVPLMLLPLMGVTTHLCTTVPEVERFVEGCGEIGKYLAGIFKGYEEAKEGVWSKVLWDVAAVAYVVNPNWTPSYLTSSPIVSQPKNATEGLRRWEEFDTLWSHDITRHQIRCAYYIDRDCVFGDFFGKLAAWSNGKISIDR